MPGAVYGAGLRRSRPTIALAVTGGSYRLQLCRNFLWPHVALAVAQRRMITTSLLTPNSFFHPHQCTLHSNGTCDLFRCRSGWIDNDRNASTPCVPCGVGHFTRAGESGPCELQQCDFGTIDHDSDPTTPCRAACAAGHFVPPVASGNQSRSS